jgi:hypothetical protein
VKTADNCFTNAKVDWAFGSYITDANALASNFGMECKYEQCVNVRCLEITPISQSGVCTYGCQNVEVIMNFYGSDIGADFCLYGCDNLKTLSVGGRNFGANFCNNGCNSLVSIYANGTNTEIYGDSFCVNGC